MPSTLTPVRTFNVRISGRPGVPLLVSNKQSADPLNPYAKKMREITEKHHSKRTEDDFQRMAELQFRSSFYLNEKKEPVIPAVNLENVIIQGAKKFRKGPYAKAGVVVLDDAELIYDGPRSVDKLFGDSRFVKRDLIPNKAGMTAVTRPQFQKWALEFTVQVDGETIDPADVQRALEIAGQAIGMGNWRPRHGRFVIEKFEEIK